MATVRSAAAAFGISKSTVHKDLRTLLPKVSRSLYLEVLPILEENKAQRHIRGGMATRQKYRGGKASVNIDSVPLYSPETVIK